MKNKIFITIIVAIFLIIFFIFYKGLNNSNIYKPDVKINKSVPSFQTKTFETNKKINSEEIFKSDKFYLINIWASWCIPCRDEHPFLISLGGQKNLEIIGLNYKDNRKNAKFFLDELNNPYKQIFLDENGTIAIEWGAYGIPESFLIYNNRIIKKIIGPLNESLLLEIKKIIK
jgi:cytochrome c biogenesis protein CcmG, thiol:disulfide interchange protein DsbE